MCVCVCVCVWPSQEYPYVDSCHTVEVGLLSPSPHVDGHHVVVSGELPQLVAPGEPELEGREEVE